MISKSRWTFDLKYFILVLIFLVVEILIAMYVQDDFIRPYLGDVLVVILIYCFLRSFWRISVLNGFLLVLAFSFIIESSQYLNLVKALGLQRSTFANVVLGTSFSWGDLGMYLTGGVLVLMAERMRKNYQTDLNKSENLRWQRRFL